MDGTTADRAGRTPEEDASEAQGAETELTPPRCLICDLCELCRKDVDGLCFECRACVALGLYRIVTVEVCRASDRFGRTGQVPVFERFVELATCVEDPLGTEYPNHIDPIPYRPGDVRERWRAIDRQREDVARAERILSTLSETG
jgi:hypothetical protein